MPCPFCCMRVLIEAMVRRSSSGMLSLVRTALWQITMLPSPMWRCGRLQALLGSNLGRVWSTLNNVLLTPCTAQAYAADEELFFQKFSEQYFNLTWLGVDPSVKKLGV